MTNLGHHKEQSASALIEGAEKIVIKIGSALLFNPEENGLQTSWLEGLVSDVARLHRGGKQVIIVSSGAIALGRDEMKLAKGRIDRKFKDRVASAATELERRLKRT